jgi:glyceraldehyde 3-phosphate dehydrogenase
MTHVKICGWYDNEYGSYTNLLADLTVHVRNEMG